MTDDDGIAEDLFAQTLASSCCVVPVKMCAVGLGALSQPATVVAQHRGEISLNRSSRAVALAMRFFSFLDPAVAQQASFQPGPVFPADAKLESVFSGGLFLKGSAAAADGSVYFSNITITSQTGGKPGTSGVSIRAPARRQSFDRPE